MRQLTLGTLSTLLLALGAVPAAQAESMNPAEEQAYTQNQRNVRSTAAFDLVSAAYRGKLESAGIPSYHKLQQAYETGQVDAEDIVNSAIAAGELSPTAAGDEGYMNAVSLHLSDITDRGQDDN
ncbi:hypothetical protein PCC7418_1806 [Halothece sp. PCC 7418]|uniref:hypothetical protein n=1 Tax=Halothece sp. (strain PCC 7418) TaxID=65093 RepID=UPI0002A05CFB|nr:hypothetical protein [Halothece sp. PCC 7418]AFZ43975.1 hypothetical protein PCC7418_1806 [Halothece sp. PCC 7418]